MGKISLEPVDERKKYEKYVIFQGIIYIILQVALFFLPADPYTDYYNHIDWGIGYEAGLQPYKDYSGNEYPVLSAYGWIVSYHLSPRKTYIWLSIMMNFPYFILAFFGGLAFYSIICDTELNPKQAFQMTGVFYFIPLNFIDTLNNHGSLGTSSTVIIAIYFLRKNRLFWSAAFLTAGISIKVYPIFVTPFLVFGNKDWNARIKYSFYWILWLLFYHIPVITILRDYYDVLFWRTTRRDGITYSFLIELIVDPLGNEHLPTLIWLGGLGIVALILLFEDNLTLLHKYAMIIMVNNLLEPRGGIGHINTALPIMAIYFLVFSNNEREKLVFVLYVFAGTLWGFGRFIINPDDFSFWAGVTLILGMIISTTIVFVLYVRGLIRMDKIQFTLFHRMKSHNNRN